MGIAELFLPNIEAELSKCQQLNYWGNISCQYLAKIYSHYSYFYSHWNKNKNNSLESVYSTPLSYEFCDAKIMRNYHACFFPFTNEVARKFNKKMRKDCMYFRNAINRINLCAPFLLIKNIYTYLVPVSIYMPFFAFINIKQAEIIWFFNAYFFVFRK